MLVGHFQGSGSDHLNSIPAQEGSTEISFAMPIQEGLKYLCTRGQGRDKLTMHTQEDNAGIERLRTHLTSFAGVQGFEVSRYFAINDRACLNSTVFCKNRDKTS
jgi:hypothetical protein